jgi:hypothetical protein
MFLQSKKDPNAFRILLGIFHRSDEAASGYLPTHTFAGVLSSYGIKLTPPELDILYLQYSNSKNEIYYPYLLGDIIGGLADTRGVLIDGIFKAMSNFSSSVSIQTLNEYYIPGVHSDVLSSWDSEGEILKEDFINFYREISVCYANDADFEQLISKTWKAKPKSMIPTVYVTVTRADGSLVNTAIEDPLGIIGISSMRERKRYPFTAKHKLYF